MRKSTRSLGLILFATLALSGCSLTLPGGPAKTAEAPSGEAATGAEITGSDYSFRAPDGWESAEYPAEGQKPDAFMVRSGDSDGFADNFNTMRSPAGKLEPEFIEKNGLAEFDGIEGAEATVSPRIQVAGAETVHFTIDIKNSQGHYALEQFYPTSDSITYVATFTFSGDVPQAERMKVAEATLASWQWK